jgi:hypothetical protein
MPHGARTSYFYNVSWTLEGKCVSASPESLVVLAWVGAVVAETLLEGSFE